MPRYTYLQNAIVHFFIGILIFFYPHLIFFRTLYLETEQPLFEIFLRKNDSFHDSTCSCTKFSRLPNHRISEKCNHQRKWNLWSHTLGSLKFTFIRNVRILSTRTPQTGTIITQLRNDSLRGGRWRHWWMTTQIDQLFTCHPQISRSSVSAYGYQAQNVHSGAVKLFQI